ncbi:MAPK regulated corepressor interacting protein 2-like isoform X2 [Pecten maximus]|uniref:MAPK regulated corepressor interacting protein 2-like isoform X2 n=1 Tax=Pecten maximus TaxID=6579 RepID=UPI0014587794|nr:MAPK regulated corepressor interacting protein 2-like isoform X2 [Pecten maximus]
MYALSRGPRKIVASTRRGPATQLDNLEIKDTEKEPSNGVIMSSPRPYFNPHAVRRGGGNFQRPQNANGSQLETSSQIQHEELVRFVMQSWSKVKNEMEMSSRNSNQRDGGPVVYKDKMHNPSLQGFEPFDLASYWGTRTMQKITGSS